MISESIKMSIENILKNKMRSFLTILGILIGVASIISLMSIVQGVTTSITTEFANLGADKITVQAFGNTFKSGLNQNDIDTISAIDNIKGVSPSVTSQTTVMYNNKLMSDVTVEGRNDIHFDNNDDLLQTGRVINNLDVESRSRVCLIGTTVEEELFPTENPIGKSVVINGINYLIIGTIESNMDFATGGGNSIVIPYTTAMGLLGVGTIKTLDIYLENSELLEETGDTVKNTISAAFNYDENAFMMIMMQSIIDMISTMTDRMSLMLVGIASIALVVGGIGIMNMMLVSVTERTKEIGLRKALGARPRDIRQQFILEALFLSILGGTLGIIIGGLISATACSLIGIAISISGSSVALAFGFSACIGLVFGYAPAKKASDLNPIDALRHS